VLVNILTLLHQSLNDCSAPLTEHCKSLSKHFTWPICLFFHLLSTHCLLCIKS